jgi:hypothetical protein
LQDLRRWVRTTLLGHQLADEDLPWFTFPATRFLARVIAPGWSVFEWGSGASTLYFARRGCRVISVEHDAAWAKRMASALEPYDGVQVLPYASGDADYVRAVAGGPVEGFDLAVVDGVRRPECLRAAMSRVRSGGLLLVDDSEREENREPATALSPDLWQALHFPGPKPSNVWPVFTRTTVWRRTMSPRL